jgi:arginase
MSSTPRRFDLALSYPQWQGSGRNANLPRGARAAAETCGRYAPLAAVPLAGDGEAVSGIQRWTAILEQFRSAQHLLHQRHPTKLLTAGGDCAVDVAVIDYLHGLYPDLTVLWVDAHLDANTAGTSPSGSFHGMPVSAIVGNAPAEMQSLLRYPLPAAQFRYVSAGLGDEGDWYFQKAHALAWLGADEVFDGPVHIHFDLDVFDPQEFPHLAYTDGNLSIEAGIALVRRFASSLVGLTITEFAPSDVQAASEGSHVIARLCDAAQGVPLGDVHD